MIRVQILGEGPRDEAAAPPLVENLLDRKIIATFTAWSSPSIQRFHQKGLSKLGKKLMFALARARADDLHGVVAIIDDDQHDGERLDALKEGREVDRRTNLPIPTALGCAVPHFEAWLIDDLAAVREVLRLPRDQTVPPLVGTPSPKKALHALYDRSPRTDDKVERDLLPEIARRLQLNRCNQRKQTGLRDFADDLRSEFKDIPK